MLTPFFQKASALRIKIVMLLSMATIVFIVCVVGQCFVMLDRALQKRAIADREHAADVRDGIKARTFVQTTDELVTKLSAKPSTNSIALFGRKFGEDTFAVIGQVTDLRELTTYGVAVTDNDLSHLANLKELRRFENWGDTVITDSGLKHLRQLTKLEKLALGTDKVTSAGLVDLKPLVALKSLTLFNLSGTGLTHLTELPLEHLAVADRGITDESIAVLPQFKSLTKVELYKTSVTNKGLKILAQCKGLKEIKLHESQQITDQGVLALSGLSQLELLDVTDTAVTSAGAAKLKSALPKVKVITGSWRTQPREPSELADIGWYTFFVVGALALSFATYCVIGGAFKAEQ